MVAKALGGITTSMITTAARLSDIVGASTMTVTTPTVSHATSDVSSAVARTPPPAAGKQVSDNSDTCQKSRSKMCVFLDRLNP